MLVFVTSRIAFAFCRLPRISRVRLRAAARRVRVRQGFVFLEEQSPVQAEERIPLRWSKELMGDRQWFVLYVLICLEVGVFLLLVPWSLIWERNYFLETYPALRPLFLDSMFRGAVSGLGVANIYLGLNEVIGQRTRNSNSTELFPGGIPLGKRSPNARTSATDDGERQTVATREKHS